MFPLLLHLRVPIRLSYIFNFEEKKDMKKDISRIIVTIGMCFIILTPLICFNWTQGRKSESENRALADFPELFDKNGKFSETLSKDFIAWFEDNLGLRDQFLNISNFINYNIFHRSTSNKVEFGKDGWLYYTADNNLDLARGTYPGIDEDSLKKYCDQQMDIQKRLAEQGIDYVLIIPPSKVSIYPEYIASGDYTVRKTAADIFADYLETHSDIKVIRLKDMLLEEKEKTDELLFFKTDTHWSYYGRYAGYKKIISDMNKWDIVNSVPVQVEFYETQWENGDLSKMLGPVIFPGKYIEESYSEYKLCNAKARMINEGDRYETLLKLAEREGIGKDQCKLFQGNMGGHALVYCDSMIFICITPMLAEHFSEAVYLWSTSLNQEMIEYVKPDVVIAEVAERKINHYIKRFGADYLKTEIHVDKQENIMDIDYYDNGEYETMYFPTWSELNGQDDLVWYKAQRTDQNTWHVSVNLSEHHTDGVYTIHFYSEDDGSKTYVHGTSYDVGDLKSD